MWKAPRHERMVREKLLKRALKYDLLGLLNLVVLYALVQLILHSSQLVCKKIEQGITQAEPS